MYERAVRNCPVNVNNRKIPRIGKFDHTLRKLRQKLIQRNATSTSHLNIKRNCIIYLCLHIFIHIEATDKSISAYNQVGIHKGIDRTICKVDPQNLPVKPILPCNYLGRVKNIQL